ncbi:thiamine pyrophosphate-binding protein [Paraburkholderia edwinii]|uniref:Thiamine pyrophosphate-binding protein n=1 Tax=Paraburkholderia edwinii TaxID=2861782 RepID=A0ABX8UYX3_9BURK|nr:thiamine pyrophosphate-binding protein [Paraburkholderia edwinii]QYD73492.1 thiamine pyrophosphate-binding protein [Paraburkholderia edwinii]
MNVADAIVKVLRDEGIRHVFCVPGAAIDPLLEALSRQHDVEAVVCAHEAGAAFAADGYSRASGRFGVYATTSGPGFTNTMTALATAYTDRSAVLAISGEVRRDAMGRGAFQDSSAAGMRANSMATPVTALQLDLNVPALTFNHLHRLLNGMLGHATRGPVHLSIPADVQRADVAGSWSALDERLYQPRFVDAHSCGAFWDRVDAGHKVAILAGSGCVQSRAAEELKRFAERFDVPVATTLAAKGVFPEDHPLSLGVLGWCGNHAAHDALTRGELDALFVIGSRLNMLDTVMWSEGLKPRHAMIVNDINVSNVFRDYEVDLSILGDARTCLEMLNDASHEVSARLRASRAARRDWVSELKARHTSNHADVRRHARADSLAASIHPGDAILALRRVMPRSTRLFIDSGAHAFFAGHYWTAYEPGRFFTSIKYMGAMGWAIPAAMGAQLGAQPGAQLTEPNDPCVVVTGDGCMLMHGVEIQTAARYGVPLICVVFNNSAFGNPKLRADRVSEAMARLHALPTHDWAKFANSVGALGITVDDPLKLTHAFEQALAAKTTVVVDVRTGNYPTPTERFDEEALAGSSH